MAVISEESVDSVRMTDKKQKEKRAISTSFKIFITIWAFVENGLFSGLRAGWSALVYILKQEHIYADLCNTDNRNFTTVSISVSHYENMTEDSRSNTTDQIGCNEQDAVFNQCFTVASASMAFSALMYGQLNYKFGIRVPRILSVILFVGGACCFAFIDKDLPWLIFPGLLLISSGGMALYITNNQISYMYSTGSAAVVGLLCGALEASAIVQTIIKILYEHSISLFICYLTLAGLYCLTLISTIFFLPKDFIIQGKIDELSQEKTVPNAESIKNQQTVSITASSESVNTDKLGITGGIFSIKRNDTLKATGEVSEQVNNYETARKEIVLAKKLLQGTDLYDDTFQGAGLYNEAPAGTEGASPETDLYNGAHHGSEGTSQGTNLYKSSQEKVLYNETSQECDAYNESSQLTSLYDVLHQGTYGAIQGTSVYNESSQGTDLYIDSSHGSGLYNETSQNEAIKNTKDGEENAYLTKVTKDYSLMKVALNPQNVHEADVSCIEKDFPQTGTEIHQTEIQKTTDENNIMIFPKSHSVIDSTEVDGEITEVPDSHKHDSGISQERTLLKCLLTKTFLLYLFWAVAVQIILSMSLGTFNPWLEYVTNKDKLKVSEFTDVLFYSMLGSPILALCFGLAIDAMKRPRAGDTKPAAVRTLNSATVSLGMTSILSVLVCGLFMVCTNDVVIITSIALVLFRTGLYSCGTAFLRIMYPTHYFGILCGIMSVLSGSLGFLQYPLFIWVQKRNQAWLEVFGFLGVVGIVSFIQPLYLFRKSRLYKRASYLTTKDSYDRLNAESPCVQEIE